jgi:GABA(A) receptor-associated protein
MLTRYFKKEPESFEFSQKNNLEQRKEFSKKLNFKYPDCIPVIIKKNINDKILQDIDKNRYLIPKNLNMSEVIYIIRNRIKIESKSALFIFVGNGTLVPSNYSIKEVYDNYKNEDGFLYIIYTAENTFG